MWAAGDAYEAYMGRWSRPLAREFLRWLDPRPAANWLEVGCGTGALSSAICDQARPACVTACDPSSSFIDHARQHERRATFLVADAGTLPRDADGFDYIVSGLVLNFVSDPAPALDAMRARLRHPGTVAAYVWDYSDGMEFLRRFWDEAIAGDPGAASLDEGARFPLSHPRALVSQFEAAGLTRVSTHALDVPTHFASFDDYWAPFLRGTGPAPAYVGFLNDARRDELRRRLERRLTPDSDGRIRLTARAWAVRGESA